MNRIPAPPALEFDADALRSRLDDAIKAAGKSRRQVSLEVGYSEGYLGRIVNGGIADPGVASLSKIAGALGTTVLWLAYGVEREEPQGPREEAVDLALELRPNNRFVRLACKRVSRREADLTVEDWVKEIANEAERLIELDQLLPDDEPGATR